MPQPADHRGINHGAGGEAGTKDGRLHHSPLLPRLLCERENLSLPSLPVSLLFFSFPSGLTGKVCSGDPYDSTLELMLRTADCPLYSPNPIYLEPFPMHETAAALDVAAWW